MNQQHVNGSRARRFWLRTVLVGAMALPMLIFYAIGTLGPLLISDLAVAPHGLGWLVMSAFGLAALLSLWAGPLVNALGSRRALALLFWATLAGYGLLLCLPGVAGVILALAVCGVAQALANPVTNLLVLECVEPASKPAVVGLKQSGVQLSALFSGLLLPSLTAALGWRGALATLLVPALALALWGPRVAPTATPCKALSLRIARPNSRLALLLSVQLCVGLVLSAFVTFLGVFAVRQGVSSVQTGAMVAGFGAMGMVARTLLTPLGARLREEAWLLCGLLVLASLALGVTAQATPEAHWPLWFGALGMGLTAVACNAIAMSMLLRDPAFGSPAPASGLLSAGFFLGFALGPLLFGLLEQAQGGFASAWLSLIAVLLLGAGFSLRLGWVRRRAARGCGMPARVD